MCVNIILTINHLRSTDLQFVLFEPYRQCNLYFIFPLRYRGIHEKGSGDVVSAVCYTRYTIYPSFCTQTAETSPSEPFL